LYDMGDIFGVGETKKPKVWGERNGFCSAFVNAGVKAVQSFFYMMLFRNFETSFSLENDLMDINNNNASIQCHSKCSRTAWSWNVGKVGSFIIDEKIMNDFLVMILIDYIIII
jgi:hypothetical protein